MAQNRDCEKCVHYGVCYRVRRKCTDGCLDFEDKSLFVKLPFNIGSVVYRISWKNLKDTGACISSGTDCYDCDVEECPIEGRDIHEKIHFAFPWELTSMSCVGAAMDGLGITVFLTPEAAEQRIKELQSSNNQVK